MVLFAAFNVLLAHHSNQNDLIVGTPIANRQHADIENLIGFFVNTLALRTRINPHDSFITLLHQVKQATFAAYAHQDLPFEQLVDHLHVERSLSHTPLFQVMFVLQNNPEADVALNDLKVLPQPTLSKTAKFDLTLSLQETAQGLSGGLEYATTLFNQDSMQRLLDHWQLLLQSIVAKPEAKIHTLPLLSRQEQQQILVDWNNTALDYPKNQTLHALFEAQVKKTPKAIALVFEEQTLSYRQLNEKANQLAHLLIAQGVKPDTLVALCLERSLELVIAILATLKAGGAYVPLDPDAPQDRLDYIIDDTQTAPGYHPASTGQAL